MVPFHVSILGKVKQIVLLLAEIHGCLVFYCRLASSKMPQDIKETELIFSLFLSKLCDLLLCMTKTAMEKVVEYVGCFQDNGGNRALPIYYKDLRKQIDWNNMNATINECASLANKQGKGKEALPACNALTARKPLCYLPCTWIQVTVGSHWLGKTEGGMLDILQC